MDLDWRFWLCLVLGSLISHLWYLLQHSTHAPTLHQKQWEALNNNHVPHWLMAMNQKSTIFGQGCYMFNMQCQDTHLITKKCVPAHSFFGLP